MPTSIERWYFFFALVAFNAMPFLVGNQPLELNSLQAAGVLSVEGDSTNQIIFALLYALGGVLMLAHIRLRTLVHLGWPLALLITLCLLSALSTDAPALVVRRCGALLGTVLLGLYSGLRFDFSQMLRLMSRVAAMVLVASLLVAALLPSLGLDAEGRLRGVYTHKNEMGGAAALFFLIVVARLMEARYRFDLPKNSLRLLAVACAAALILSHSATPAPTLVIALVAMLAMRFALVVFAAIILPQLELAEMTSVLGRDSTLSGRTTIWAFVSEMIAERPWLGYGYGGAFWMGPNGGSEQLFARTNLATPHAHNGFLELTLGVGIFGPVLLAAAIVLLLRRAIRLRKTSPLPLTPCWDWVVGFVTFYAVLNLSENEAWGGNHLMTEFLVYVVVRTNVLASTMRASIQAAKPTLPPRGTLLTARLPGQPLRSNTSG